jgi:signal transduction histidine kinase
LSEKISPPVSSMRPGKIVVGAVYLLYAAVVIRTIANQNIRPRLPIYLALEVLYFILFTLMLWRPHRQPIWRHIYFVFQSILVLTLILLRPKFDFITILYVILSLQVVLIFSGRAGWIWVASLTMLTVVPLVVTLGVLQGLSLGLMPMTIGIVFAAYAAVTKEIEAGLRTRQALLSKLQVANEQLTISTGQAEELSAIQERNRLARELHDSISQTIFSISLHTSATRIMLERAPERVQSQLERLQALTQNALRDMRSLIANLRPQENDSLRTKT